ncbi:unnamed protein product, partial [Symbiodinium sp. KB8]
SVEAPKGEAGEVEHRDNMLHPKATLPNREIRQFSVAQNASPSAPQAELTPWETRKEVQLLTLLTLLRPRHDHAASRPAGGENLQAMNFEVNFVEEHTALLSRFAHGLVHRRAADGRQVSSKCRKHDHVGSEAAVVNRHLQGRVAMDVTEGDGGSFKSAVKGDKAGREHRCVASFAGNLCGRRHEQLQQGYFAEP